MPIYEYQCQQCDHELETLQKMSDPVLTECPACGANALVKKVSAPGFRLSGSGWYETDFKSGQKKNITGDEQRPDSGKNDGKEGSNGQSSNKQNDTGNVAVKDDNGAKKENSQSKQDKPKKTSTTD